MPKYTPQELDNIKRMHSQYLPNTLGESIRYKWCKFRAPAHTPIDLLALLEIEQNNNNSSQPLSQPVSSPYPSLPPSHPNSIISQSRLSSVTL